jgi:hypothetical protein
VVYTNVVFCPNVVGWRSGVRRRRHSATIQQTESNLYKEKDGLEKTISRFLGVSAY